MDARFQTYLLPRLKKIGILYLILLIGAPMMVYATEEASMRGLDSQQSEKVKNIGRAILQSKRRYQPDESQAQQLRTRLTELRAVLNNLTAVNNTTPLTAEQIQPSGSAVTGLNAVLANASWDQYHRADIDHLRQTSASLSAQSRTLREHRDRIANPGFFQTLRQVFSDKRAPSASLLVTPVSDAALDRLEKLETEIIDALALPATKRHARLTGLKDELQFNSVSHTSFRAQKLTNPTFVSRTQHRRDRK